MREGAGKFVTALFGAILLLTVRTALCSVYFVDQNHPLASDGNPGTPGRPFKTIGAAVMVVKPGDTVIVKPGIYREHVRLTKSGSLGAPITFVADPPLSAIITGADVIAGWERADEGAPIYKVLWAHRFVINVRADGTPVEHHPDDEKHRLWGRAEQVFVDGKPCLPALTFRELKKAWHEHRKALREGRPSPVLQPPLPGLGGPFVGMFCADTKGKNLYLWLADGSDPNDHLVEATTRAELFGVNPWANPEGVRHIVVRGFIFRHAATFPQRAAVWLHGEDNLLENCVIEGMTGGGVRVHGTMRRCVIFGNGHTGGAAVGLNEECVWAGNSWRPIERGWDAGGVKMANEEGVVFRRCLFYRNGGPGLWLDIHMRDVIVADCVFWENELHGLFVEISRNVAVVRNLFVRNGVGVVGTRRPGWGVAGLTIAESRNCLAAFNVLVGNKDGIALRELGKPRRVKVRGLREVVYFNRGHVIYGNVSAFNCGYQLAFWYDNPFFGWHPQDRARFRSEAEFEAFMRKHPEFVLDPREAQIFLDRNIYFAIEGQKGFLYGVPWRPKHREFERLSEFVKATGFDAHSLFADPKFFDLTSDDFRLRPDSPARGFVGDDAWRTWREVLKLARSVREGKDKTPISHRPPLALH